MVVSAQEYEKKAEEFYKKVLKVLSDTKAPYAIGGTYAVKYYTGIQRVTKDIDIFCKAGDYPRILKQLKDVGFKVTIEDERWLAKVTNGKYFTDLVFGSIPSYWPISDEWMKKARVGKVLEHTVKISPPEELIISKAYRMRRERFDGADITHIILKEGKAMDWKYLLRRMDPNWELLFIHLLLFRFVYPSDRDKVPKWLIRELVSRLNTQLDLPSPKDRITRGPLVSPNQYKIAVTDWGYKDVADFTFT